ncbi:hypothetical protein Aduo_007441 [Ancylostoma duodenale]
MQRPWPSSSNNFSAIARRLLLNRQPPERTETPPVLLPVAGSQLRAENLIACLPRNVPTVDEYGGIVPVQIHDAKPTISDGDSFNPDCHNIAEFMDQLPHHIQRPINRPIALCGRLRRLDKERFIALHAEDASRPVLGRRSKVLIKRVRQFFEEMKKVLGDSCEGTIFNSTVELTAWACGVTPDTVTRVGVREDFVYELFPRKKKKKVVYTFAKEKEVTLKKYNDEWGDIIRDYVKNRMSRDTDMTSYRLHAELCRKYEDFPFGRDTLYTFLSALGVKFGRVDGKRVMTI